MKQNLVSTFCISIHIENVCVAILNSSSSYIFYIYSLQNLWIFSFFNKKTAHKSRKSLKSIHISLLLSKWDANTNDLVSVYSSVTRSNSCMKLMSNLHGWQYLHTIMAMMLLYIYILINFSRVQFILARWHDWSEHVRIRDCNRRTHTHKKRTPYSLTIFVHWQQRRLLYSRIDIWMSVVSRQLKANNCTNRKSRSISIWFFFIFRPLA